MKGEILEDKKNILFDRRELSMIFESDSCPSHAEINKFISSKLSVPEENVKVKKISPKFGQKKFEVNAHVYSSKEIKEEVEPKIKIKNPKK